MAVTTPFHREAMIVAPPGFWRDALVSLVRAQPRLCVSQVQDDLAAARATLDGKTVDIVIVDSSGDEQHLLDFLAWLGATHPAAGCVIAVDTQVQQARYVAAGARATLLKGCLDETQLRSAISA